MGLGLGLRLGLGLELESELGLGSRRIRVRVRVRAGGLGSELEREDAFDDDDLRPVDVRVVLGAEARVRDEVVGRHGHGLVACALQLVDHREQVVEVELTEDEAGSAVGRRQGSAGAADR